MINTTTRKFEADLAQIINNAALPACVIRLVLDKYLNQVTAIEQECLVKEQATAENASEKQTTAETEEEEEDIAE